VKKTLTARISSRVEIAEDLFCLRIDLGENRRQFSFKAGQYLTLGLFDSNGSWVIDSGKRPALRPYSIVSAPDEKNLEIFVELVSRDRGGNLTPLLYGLREGDMLQVLPEAKGIFIFEPEYKNQVMVATVTGIAPFVSIIRDYRKTGGRDAKFFVLHGASYFNEFGYDNELLDLSGKWPEDVLAAYVRTISRPDDPRNANIRKLGISETGRVNGIIEKYLGSWGLEIKDTIIYVCGHPGMIENVKNRLSPNGWMIKEERFWK